MRFHLLAVTVLSLAAASGLAPRAQAGPPLICHPFDIGVSESLPWGGGPEWRSPSPSYDTKDLVADTLALLTPNAPVLVRMETLRRAAIYSAKQPGLAYELLSRLMGRALSAEPDHKDAAMAWFDAGYLVETYRQARWDLTPNMVEGLDGYGWTLKAIRLGGSPEMEFAASLIQSTKNWPNQHLKKARAAAPQGSLLARNLARYTEVE